MVALFYLHKFITLLTFVYLIFVKGTNNSLNIKEMDYLELGDEIQIVTDYNDGHQFHRYEIAQVTCVCTDGTIYAQSEESGEWILENKDYIIL